MAESNISGVGNIYYLIKADSAEQVREKFPSFDRVYDAGVMPKKITPIRGGEIKKADIERPLNAFLELMTREPLLLSIERVEDQRYTGVVMNKNSGDVRWLSTKPLTREEISRDLSARFDFHPRDVWDEVADAEFRYTGRPSLSDNPIGGHILPRQK